MYEEGCGGVLNLGGRDILGIRWND